ncbi:hypothetical protein Hamer_G026188 [Homarus americanus]|uniref:Uncharacterized protein n=2 Tax=Homarus americanus TaxID=6706 RepID=A0A8J5N3P3_HOMAM|nr:hypothetical protein Hamer_G026188 [Homarus americanus]
MYLKTQFGTTKDSWLIHDNDDDDLPAITLDSPVADRVRRYGVTKLVGLGQEHSRTTSTSTLSAGVLLSPSNISGTEPHTYIHHQAFTNLSYDNQAYET